MTVKDSSRDRVALELSVTGMVQGVGFRPFVHRLAVKHGLAGWVRNEAGEVRVLIEGSDASVRQFIDSLSSDAPPLARIDSLAVETLTPEALTEFRIVASTDAADRRSLVSPDVAICEACLAELTDPTNSRFRYPFITCTDCGPRFTVIEAMPYDRARTSMRAFDQCANCLAEYETPDNRRYHSESNSCPACGPSVWLELSGSDQSRASGFAAISEAAEMLCDGKIVALRGLGGFHLAANATDEVAVARLRRHKNREAKPLAIMVRSLVDVRAIAAIDETQERLLTSPEGPIVLVRPKEDAGLAPSVAPGLDTVGVMTAYTPLHHVLLDLVARPLVMTSGNKSDEPIAIGKTGARESLSGIADALLLHDREIVARYDDSVVRVVEERSIFLRRARGYAPMPVNLPVPAMRPIFAVGPHLKNTFTLAHGNKAYVSQHIGDLENLETLEHFKKTFGAFKRLFRIEPEVAVRDLHPEYMSTRVAEDVGLSPVYTVQHHHAHIAAVAAEHGVTERVIGFAYDGAGYGDDGTVWGAETLVADLCSYERSCRLRYAPLPGGDLAAREPWRTALGYLSLAPGAEEAFQLAIDSVDGRASDLARRQIERNLNAPLASSMGRLFDAAAAVLGVRTVSHYEGQAAMELEALAGDRPATPISLPVLETDGEVLELDPVPLLVALGELRAAGRQVEGLAAAFHESVAQATAGVAKRIGERTGIRTVALGGGVFQNARLLSSLVQRLKSFGFTVLVPRQLSPNDGAISYGQAAVAAALMHRDAACRDAS